MPIFIDSAPDVAMIDDMYLNLEGGKEKRVTFVVIIDNEPKFRSNSQTESVDCILCKGGI